jgi:hypothetical protein
MTVEVYRGLHRQHAAWIEAELSRAVGEKKRCVVLTHHAPVKYVVPQISVGKVLTEGGCLGTDLVGPESRINNKKFAGAVQLWCFGHTHLSYSQKTECGIRMAANQVGYPQDQAKQRAFGTMTNYVAFDKNLKLVC